MRKLLIAIVAAALLGGTAHATTIEMKVNGLVCAFCAQGIEKKLRKMPATADVVISLENKLVAVGIREGQDIADAELTQTLKDAGYDVKSIARTERSLAAIREELARSRQ